MTQPPLTATPHAPADTKATPAAATPEGVRLPDPVEWAKTMSELAERSQKLLAEFVARNQSAQQGGAFGRPDPLNASRAFLDLTRRMMADPVRLVRAQMDLWRQYVALWATTTDRLMGRPSEPIVDAKGDKRFKDQAWQESTIFDFVKQSYLLSARWLQGVVHDTPGLDQKTRQKVDFYTRQFVDAMSPSNFIMTNPEVLRATLETGGENLVNGLRHLLEDLERGHGTLLVKMTDLDAFEVGRNIAITPGKVVFQNELMQLIQYSPTTETVDRRPLLIVPPWINKYYILDLRQDNSFVKWAVDQGLTVFMVSWVNPGPELANKGFEDYLDDGLIAALDAVERATGEREINVIGYCIGGTLLAGALAYLKQRGDTRVASATYFTAMVDFREPGEITVFIDEEQLASLEQRMEQQGFLDAESLHIAFNLLRANDLIWSFVVNNYLLGKEPFPFDLLYWNGDSTRMPAEMHAFYLRNMYKENRLAQPGGITLHDVPIDVRTVDVPTFIQAAKEDHIAPWRTVYFGSHLFSGPVTFVLAQSGHVAGVVNPPTAKKYGHWTNEAHPAEPPDWLAGATEHKGSWWTTWRAWLRQHAGGEVPARTPGTGGLPALEDAPGSYVKVKAIN